MIVELEINHIDQVVAIHIEAFSESFLTQLGSKFLAILYKEFSRSGYGYVYLVNDQVAGFLAGIFSKADIFYRNLFKKNFFVLIPILAFSIIQNPNIVKPFFFRGIRLFFRKKPMRIDSLPEYDVLMKSQGIVASALTMAVSIDFRGRGIASQLWTYLLNDLPNKDVEAIIGSVQSSNIITIKFYNKRGFKQIARIQRDYGDEELKWLFFQKDKCSVSVNGKVSWFFKKIHCNTIDQKFDSA